ncbi:MAG: ABC transporter permease [Clostridia bacterium]|nr:ABC transporter permease [Clostridia bacterium]
MKQTLKNVFSSPKFLIGFILFMVLLITSLAWPLFADFGPLQNVVQKNGGFAAPGTYVNVADAVELVKDNSSVKFDVDTSANRLAHRLDADSRQMMVDWLHTYATAEYIPDINADDAAKIQELTIDDMYAVCADWEKYYDFSVMPKTIKKAERNKYNQIDKKVQTMLSNEALILASKGENGLQEDCKVPMNAFVNTKDVASRYTLILGSDNFGRDVFTELTSSILVSMRIGLIAGCIATLIGMTLGLLAGFIGGVLDNIITFFTNLFTVIPSFVLLILIANAVGGSHRGVTLIALLIGFTGWTWTARSVRSQVLSLRNRDHVNMSKISGHSTVKIIIQDILPFVASYVVMAFILQISSGILAEAQLSMLGLGPATTEVSTLGLMMHWALSFNAHTQGMWWAFLPVIFSIALITFSLNLMNTGLDQVFNPQLRD